MSNRDRRALTVGIILGLAGAGLTIASVYAAGIVFLILAVLFPLSISLMAEQRIISLSLVPNILMALVCLLIYFVFLTSWPSSLMNYGATEKALGVLAVLLMAIIPALAMSIVIKLIRRKRAA